MLVLFSAIADNATVVAAASPAEISKADDAATAAASAAADALAAVRSKCIGAASLVREQERALGALQHQTDLLGQDVAGRQRDLDGSRPEQQQLLDTLALLARNLNNPLAAAAQPPLDRARGELLIGAVVTALRAEARALSEEINETAALKEEIAARRRDLAATRAALTHDRDQMAQLVAQRSALIRQMSSRANGTGAAAPATIFSPRALASVTTVSELIRLADTAIERRDRMVRSDPTRPSGLRAFDPPQSALLLPVSGSISRHFGDPDPAGGAPSQAIGIAAPAGAAVVAPFDGRIVYAGQFRDLGLVLIIRHGDRYHSAMLGLGQIDVAAGEWVLAGEPIGAMAEAAAPAAAAGSAKLLTVEVFGAGLQPVDPSAWLAAAPRRDETAASTAAIANGNGKTDR